MSDAKRTLVGAPRAQRERLLDPVVFKVSRADGVLEAKIEGPLPLDDDYILWLFRCESNIAVLEWASPSNPAATYLPGPSSPSKQHMCADPIADSSHPPAKGRKLSLQVLVRLIFTK